MASPPVLLSRLYASKKARFRQPRSPRLLWHRESSASKQTLQGTPESGYDIGAPSSAEPTLAVVAASPDESRCSPVEVGTVKNKPWTVFCLLYAFRGSSYLAHKPLSTMHACQRAVRQRRPEVRATREPARRHSKQPMSVMRQCGCVVYIKAFPRREQGYLEHQIYFGF